jgi:hypothetical protein
MSHLGDNLTWADWVQLHASDVGLVLTDDEIDWLMWNETAWPMTTAVDYLRPQVLEALYQRAYEAYEGVSPYP